MSERKVIGHHYVELMSNSISNGDIRPKITQCPTAAAVDVLAKASMKRAIDRYENYYGYLKVYDDGDVVLHDIGVSDEGDDDEAEDEEEVDTPVD